MIETLSFLAVVDELVAELRERRSQRQEGYVALARAILSDEPPAQLDEAA